MPICLARLPRHAVLAGVASVCAGAVMMAVAAPVGTGDSVPGGTSDLSQGGALNAPGGPGTRLPDRAALPDVPSTSKTIDLLLEMQGRNPGLAGGERPRNTEMPTARPRVAQPAVDVQPFGNDAAPRFGRPEVTPPRPAGVPVRPEAGTIDWSDGGGRGMGQPGWSSGGAQAPAMSDSVRNGPRDDRVTGDGMPEARWLLIPRSVVRFVRENRDMVIGASVAVLLALWAATTFASGRRK